VDKERRKDGSKKSDRSKSPPPSTSGVQKAEPSDQQVSLKKENAKASEEIWSKNRNVADAERTMEDEFDEFLEDLFM